MDVEDHLARQPLDPEQDEQVDGCICGDPDCPFPALTPMASPGNSVTDDYLPCHRVACPLTTIAEHDAKVRADTLAEIDGLLVMAHERAVLSDRGAPGWPSLAPGLRHAVADVEKARAS